MNSIHQFVALKNLIKCMSEQDLTILLFVINIGQYPSQDVKISNICKSAIFILKEFDEDDLEITNMYIANTLATKIEKEHVIPSLIDSIPKLTRSDDE